MDKVVEREVDVVNQKKAIKLAEERGFSNPELHPNGHLVVSKPSGNKIDYSERILLPHGLVESFHKCTTWTEACRLLSMLPPAR